MANFNLTPPILVTQTGTRRPVTPERQRYRSATLVGRVEELLGRAIGRLGDVKASGSALVQLDGILDDVTVAYNVTNELQERFISRPSSGRR